MKNAIIITTALAALACVFGMFAYTQYFNGVS
jgi:hypothetical protein